MTESPPHTAPTPPTDGSRARAMGAIAILMVAFLGLLLWVVTATPWTADEFMYYAAGENIARSPDFAAEATTRHGPLPYYGNRIGSWLGLPTTDVQTASEENKIAGRVGMLLFPLLGAAAVARLAWLLFGPLSSVLALALFVTQPLVLGHGSLMSADMALAACYALLAWAFLSYRQRPGPRTLLWTGACLGLTLGTKYISLLIAVGTAIAVGVQGLRRGQGATRYGRALGDVLLLTLVSILTLHLTYLFRVPLFPTEGTTLDPEGLLHGIRELPLLGSLLSVLPDPFLRGVEFQWVASKDFGVTTFAGALVPGHPLYYSVGLITKSSLLLVVSATIALNRLPRVWSRPGPLRSFVFCTALAPFAFLSLGTEMMLGVRYVLFLVPIACIYGGAVLADLCRAPRQRWALPLVPVALLLPLLIAMPRPVGFFNLLSLEPQLLFGDSNLDLQRDRYEDPLLPGLLAKYPDADLIRFSGGPRFGPTVVHGADLWPSQMRLGPVEHWLQQETPIDRSGPWLVFGDPQADESRVVALLGRGEIEAARTMWEGIRDTRPESDQTTAITAHLELVTQPAPPAPALWTSWTRLGRYDRILADRGAPPALRAAAHYQRGEWTECVGLLLELDRKGQLPDQGVATLTLGLWELRDDPTALEILERRIPDAAPELLPTLTRYRERILERVSRMEQLFGEPPRVPEERRSYPLRRPSGR